MVLERIGELAYKLDLPQTMRIHDRFHIFKLKRYPSDGRAQPPLAEVIDDEPEWQVERALKDRLVTRGRKTKVEYLIKFVGYGPVNTACGNMTWKTVSTLCWTIGLLSQSPSALS